LRWVRGAILFSLFFLYSWFVVTSLVAYQFQHKIRGSDANGHPVSIEKLRAYEAHTYKQGEKYRAEKRETEILREKYDADSAEISKLKKKLDAEPGNTSLRNNITERENDLKTTKCRLYEKANLTNEAEIELGQLRLETADQFNFLLVPEPSRNGDVKQKIEAPGKENAGVGEALGNTTSENSKIAEKTGTQSAVEGRSVSSSDVFNCRAKEFAMSDFPLPPILDPEISELLKDYKYLRHHGSAREKDLIKITKRNRSPVQQYVFGPILDAGHTVLYGMNFIDMPSQMLVLIVVLLMGALGGTIRLAEDYLDKEKPIVSWDYFLFTPFLGAVTALAVYILAKAGVLIIADFGASGEASINPYFISFIGLVSGMLSTNALETIRGVGLNWFKGSAEDKERWGVNLLERCNLQDISAEDIGNLTETSTQMAENWLAERRIIPPIAQKLIAARLNIPRRELFTDMRPKKDIDTSTNGLQSEADSEDG